MPDISSRDTSLRLTTHPWSIAISVIRRSRHAQLVQSICSSSILVWLTRREHMVYTPINSVLVPESGKRLHGIGSET